MAESASSFWSDGKCSLKKAAQTFPCIVKVGDSRELQGRKDRPRLPVNRTILLEKKAKITFVHIKVTEFLSSRDAQYDYGMEFVLEHDQSLGEEYLIPIDCKGKIYLCDTPGSDNRYTDVLKVIEDMPRYLQTDTILKAVGGGNVDKGSKLEPVQVVDTGGKKCLVCKDGRGRLVRLLAGMPVNLRSVADKQHYSLRQLVDTVPLPKTAQLLDVYAEDVDNVPTGDCENHFAKVAGTIQVIGVKVTEVMVGWIRHKPLYAKKPTLVHLIIPAELWDKDPVSVKKFADKDKKERYLNRNFPECRGACVEDRLYLLKASMDEVGWIQSHISTKEFDLASDSDDSDNDYIDPLAKVDSPPPVPEFDIETDSEEEDADYINPISKHDAPPPVPARDKLGKPEKSAAKKSTPFSSLQKKVSNVTKKLKKSTVATKSPEPVTSGSHTVHHRKAGSQENPGQDGHLPQSTPTGPECEIQKQRLPDYRENDIIRQTTLKMQRLKDEKQRVEEDLLANAYDNRRPVPLPPPSPSSDGPYSYDYAVNLADMERLGRKRSVEEAGQTAADFYSYTVTQLAQCLEFCGLKPLAQICQEQNVDGEFLESLNDTDLAEEPFHLGRFELQKLKQVINGWRPKFD